MIWLAGIAACVIWYLVEAKRRTSHPITGGLQEEITLPHSETFELYSNSFSHCSRKARLAMAELGIQYRHHDIDLIETGWYQTISPEYLRVNRSGLVPTLVHLGHPVYESDDILKYAQSQSSVDLNPAEHQEEINRWLEFCSISSDQPMAGMRDNAGPCIPGLTLPMFVTSIRYIPLRRILVGLLFHSDRKRPIFFSTAKMLGLKRTLNLNPVRDMLPPARAAMANHLTTLNETLKNSVSSWLVGNQFTLADITVGVLLLRLEECGWLQHYSQQADLSALNTYYQTIKSRPSWQEAIENHRHPIIDQASQDLKVAAEDDDVKQLLYGT